MQQRILILFALMVLGHWSLLGQKEKNLVQSTKDNFNYSAFSPSSTRIMYGIAEEPGRLLGDIYLDSAFHNAGAPRVQPHWLIPGNTPGRRKKSSDS